MKVFYCGSSTIRKILLNGVLVLVYNSSIDKQEMLMAYRDYFLPKVLRLDINDRDKTYDLMHEMLDAFSQIEAKVAFAEMRTKKLIEQNQRQVAMIDNLEKTLWKKPK